MGLGLYRVTVLSGILMVLFFVFFTLQNIVKNKKILQCQTSEAYSRFSGTGRKGTRASPRLVLENRAPEPFKRLPSGIHIKLHKQTSSRLIV